MSLLPEIGGGGVHHCSSPTYKEYLTAVENGCEYIQCPSDNKKGFTKVRIKDVWHDRLQSLQAYMRAYDTLHELWQLDGTPSIAEKFSEAHRLLYEQIIYFNGHDSRTQRS